MTQPPDRAFWSVLLAGLAAVGGAVAGIALLLTFKQGTPPSGVRTVWCLIAPASSFDSAVHGATVAAVIGSVLVVVAAARHLARERIVASELRWATRAARLETLPREVATAARGVGVIDRLDIVDAARPFGFVHGWLRPRICLSTGLIKRLNESELEAVLHHERCHLERRDPWRVLVVRTISAALWFVPPVRHLADDFVLASEIAADARAVAAMGSARWLASAIAKTLSSPVAMPSFEGFADARIAVLAGESPAAIGRPGLPAVVVLIEILIITPALARGGLPILSGVWLHPVC